MILVNLLYLVLALILGILAFVLKKKHTPFPDFRVGYHHRELMESAQKWEYANRITGNLCALFAAVALILAIVLLVVKIEGRLALLFSFFLVSFRRCDFGAAGIAVKKIGLERVSIQNVLKRRPCMASAFFHPISHRTAAALATKPIRSAHSEAGAA